MRILALLGIVVCVTGGLIAASAPAKIPASINWVERGVVPPVRDQGACGGDYAYVTASSVGSLQAIHKKGKVFVSEQQLLDCASAYGGQGCRGGQLETGFQYIIANGATTRESYPVTGDSGECKVNGGAIKIKAYKNLPAGDCKALEVCGGATAGDGRGGWDESVPLLRRCLFLGRSQSQTRPRGARGGLHQRLLDRAEFLGRELGRTGLHPAQAGQHRRHLRYGVVSNSLNF